MKKFEFSLGRALDWRETLARVEESKLERLYAELRAIESSEAALDQERSRSENAIAHGASHQGSELRAFDAFRRYAVAEYTRLEQRRAECMKRIAAQIQAVAARRRDVRLLENLKHKRLLNWRRGLDREIETQAGENFLARWDRA
ncbi:MAG TPA: hypothetical protein VMG40_20545 [Bryobacteraceae bacterium]|nr:hypothetical protein [Bryobacteraceae bacterium]